MKKILVTLLIGLCFWNPKLSAQSEPSVNVTFTNDVSQYPSGPSLDASKMYLLRINSINSVQWPFGQQGTTIRVMCVDPRNSVSPNMTWDARVNFLSSANYFSTRRGYLPDAEARYKKAAYLFTRLPAQTPELSAKITSTIYYFLNERLDAYMLPDTNMVNEVNAWYAAGAYGIDWTQVVLLTDKNTAYTIPGDTTLPRGGTQEFIAFANKQTPVTLNWVRGKQVLIVADSAKTPLVENSVIKFNAYARTSAGVPVTMPLITWNLLDSSSATLEVLSNKSVLLKVNPTISKEVTELLTASWSTRSGVFKDTIPVQIIPINFTLPWQPRQQVLTLKSSDVDLSTSPNPNTSVTLTSYARTSAGVAVANPKIVYSTTSTLVTIRQVNNTIAQVSVVPVAFSGQQMATRIPVVIDATWNTSSGPLKSKTTIYITQY